MPANIKNNPNILIKNRQALKKKLIELAEKAGLNYTAYTVMVLNAHINSVEGKNNEPASRAAAADRDPFTGIS